MIQSRVPQNCCRLCGATSFRKVIARDDTGAMQATGLYQCSGCSVVFADPKAWRTGDEQSEGVTGGIEPLTPVRAS